MTINTIVISGFPGVGKSYVANNTSYSAIDSDSSKFSWIEGGFRNPDFPKNYIEHIRENIGKVEYIFVSSHKSVRDALRESGINFAIVYPAKELKEDYLKRYRERGSSEEFIAMMDKNWDDFIDGIEEEEHWLWTKLTDAEAGMTHVLESYKDHLELKGYDAPPESEETQKELKVDLLMYMPYEGDQSKKELEEKFQKHMEKFYEETGIISEVYGSQLQEV